VVQSLIGSGVMDQTDLKDLYKSKPGEQDGPCLEQTLEDVMPKTNVSRKRPCLSRLDSISPSKVIRQSFNSSKNTLDNSKQAVANPKDSGTQNENKQTDRVDFKYDYTNLLDAVKVRDYNKVTLLLQSCKHDYTLYSDILDKALWYAVYQEDLFLVKKLVFHNAKAVEVDEIHCFLFAAEKGFLAIVEHLLSHYGSLVNVKNSSGFTALHLCQMNSNNAPITKALIAAGADLSWSVIGTQGSIKSVLEIALEHRNLNSVFQLIRAGADTDMKTLKDYSRDLGLEKILDIKFEGPKGNNLTPVMKAIAAQDVELLELLLMSEYFDVNDYDDTGETTPLLKVFHMKGQRPILICKQSDTCENNLNNESNSTEVNQHCNLDMMSDAVANSNNDDTFDDSDLDANKENPDLKEPSPLKKQKECSADDSFTQIQWEMVELLIKSGSRISFEGSIRKPNQSPLLLTLEKGDCHLLQFLVDRQRFIVYDEDWSKALKMTIEKGRWDFIEVLAPVIRKLTTLESYRPIDFEDTIHIGIKKGHVECVLKLLSLIKGYDYTEALSVAAKAGQLDMLKLLQKIEPDTFQELVQTDVGTQLLCYACDSKNNSCVDLLLKFGADINGSALFLDHPMFHCMSEDYSYSLNSLLEHDVNLKKITITGQHVGSKVLEGAMKKNWTKAVRNLLLKGAEIDIGVIDCALNLDFSCRNIKKMVLKCVKNFTLNRKSKNPINSAIEKSDLDFIETLLEHKLDPNHHLESEEPPLLKAVKANYKEKKMVKLLLAHGANVDITDANGDTAMHAMSAEGCVLLYPNEIVALLMKHNINLNVTNKNGLTAVMLAAKNDVREIVMTLIKVGADLNVVRESDSTTVLDQQLKQAKFHWDAFILNDLISNGAVTYCNISGAVHRCIADEEYHALRVLTSSGYFTPVLLEESYEGCMIKLQNIGTFKGVFSPLCMALLCGQVDWPRT